MPLAKYFSIFRCEYSKMVTIILFKLVFSELNHEIVYERYINRMNE